MLENEAAAEVLFPSPDEARAGGAMPVGSRRRRVAKALTLPLLDLGLDVRSALRRETRKLDRAAAAVPPRTVHVLSIYGGDGGDLPGVLPALRSERHDVSLAFGALGDADPGLTRETVATGLGGGKFANLNRLLEASAPDADWVLILDDDVRLPARFLDRLIGAAEALRLDLCQPAQTRRSDPPWPVTRRRGDLARITRFVEIGPVCLLSREMLAEISPFDEAGMGWGLCLHWAAVAERSGRRLGIVDALPVRHETRPTAGAYDAADAKAAAHSFLASHDHIDRGAASEVLSVVSELPEPAAQ